MCGGRRGPHRRRHVSVGRRTLSGISTPSTLAVAMPPGPTPNEPMMVGTATLTIVDDKIIVIAATIPVKVTIQR